MGWVHVDTIVRVVAILPLPDHSFAVPRGPNAHLGVSDDEVGRASNWFAWPADQIHNATDHFD
jgi:hypothetical protein